MNPRGCTGTEDLRGIKAAIGLIFWDYVIMRHAAHVL